MTVIGIDDTDSRTGGMCTTYLAARLGARIRAQDERVERYLLVRLNPAVEAKTRGNAALGLHTSISAADAMAMATELIEDLALTDDPATSPGIVVAPDDPGDLPESTATFARDAVREVQPLEEAVRLIDSLGFASRGWDGGRGRIGALAAVGAWPAWRGQPATASRERNPFADATYEFIAYRHFEKCGTPREVDEQSVFRAAEYGYPEVWDTVDETAGAPVCVPHAPGPVLYGIRGDDPDVCRDVAAEIDAESIERSTIFLTNQGTDAHLRDLDTAGSGLSAVSNGRAYRVTAEVATPPQTREGGHVFLELSDGEACIDCVAFEPTKRFRDRVRALRVGDRVTVCGEVDAGTLKLEKFAARDLVRTERVVPECPTCTRSMESAGRGQGYRCRDCDTTADEKTTVRVERALERGWYEVPPSARRHIAKPLVRGGFDAPTHPER